MRDELQPLNGGPNLSRATSWDIHRVLEFFNMEFFYMHVVDSD